MLFYGATDYPLTDLGREQAREAGRKLRNIPFSRCVSSDLCRAYETAALCIEGRDMKIEAFPALREQNMGDLEGHTLDEVKEILGEQLLIDFLTKWIDTVPPSIEPPAAMLKRIGDCVDAIIERGEDTLIAAHNGTLGLILHRFHLKDIAKIMMPDEGFRHGCYSVVRIENGKVTLEGFNL